MPAISAAVAQAHLDAWLEADLATSQGQSYTIAGRTLTKNNFTEIKAAIDYWSGKLQEANAGGRRGRTRYVVPE